MKRTAGVISIWWGAGAVLAVLVAHVRDWFVMTDELLYERLALGIARTHSPLPQMHGVTIGNVNQLYPLLLAPVLDHGSISAALRDAHILGAFAMTSAAVPAYLIARRNVTTAWALLAALLCVLVPWTVLASFLLTGVVAYPAALWAVLAVVTTVERPSRRNDVLALGAVAVAITARTQLLVLGVVLVVSILARRDVRRHGVVVGAVAAALLAMLAATATGHSPLGTYAATAHGNPFPPGTTGAFFTHLAAVAIGIALIPFVVGAAWLASEARSNAFALVGGVTVVLLGLEVAGYDERFGGGLARDRYAAYLAPILLIAFVIALARGELRAVAVAGATAVLALGLALSPLPVFDKLNVDAPVAVLNGYLRDSLGGLGAARVFLVAAALVAAAAVVTTSQLLSARVRAVALVLTVLVLTTAETGYAFARLFRVPGTAGRAISADPSGLLAWIDPLVPAGASVTQVPFPIVAGDYFSSAAYWWDVEFWNRSVDRTAGVPGVFEWTPSTFPKVALRFDRRGRANATLTPYVVQAVGDTRFHLAGTVLTNNRSAFLVQADRPWRADWATAGLYDDGWTRPGVTARVLVYPYPGQGTPVRRSVTVYVFAPAGVTRRPFALGHSTAVAGADEVTLEATVCVPPDRPGVLPLSVDGASLIPGDPTTDRTVNVSRQGGLQVARIYLSGSVSAC